MGWFEVVRGYSRSLEIAPFDRTHTISYCLPIVSCNYVACVAVLQTCTVFTARRYILTRLYAVVVCLSVCRLGFDL